MDTRFHEIECNSPRDCFKEDFKLGIINYNKKWLEMIEDRNSTVHTYNPSTRDYILSKIPGYVKILKKLYQNLEKKG